MILAGNDEFYWLKKDEYQNHGHEIDTSMVGQAMHLVEQGVVLADIPVGSIPGVGAQCYLLNLRSIRRPPARPGTGKPSQHKSSAGPVPIDPNDDCLKVPAPGIDDLVIHDRKGKHFYWVKKCEYQNDGHKLDRFDPILEEQVRLLTNQGVVIADVPGGSLPDVDDMGVLVNLKGIQRPIVKQESTPQPVAGK
ncbi:hypothetical protein [Archangium sp.]|uniref:hypothetical protein n=1 Tax=Archangium sp. TaxID=1872627 RepID=UPI002D4F0BA1|nr:hypothetical protein [Archangium sp.]HYO52701.1 hypothetical protein [Archangium sp.]